MKILFTILVFIYAVEASAQRQSIGKPEILCKLPEKLSETSGLAYINGKLWTHNDSGGEPELYQVDSTGAIIKTVRITNATNVDWEELTQDDTHIYIGDFGNNYGNRKDLKIYKVAIADIEKSDSCKAEIIEFKYSNQTDFSNRKKHNFDCEAMVSIDDSLYLFSKNWENQQTYLYKLPKQDGSYSLAPTDSIEVFGLVTSAWYDEDHKMLYLLGYGFIGQVPRFPVPFGRSMIFKKNFVGSFINVQTEAIILTNDALIISCEDYMGTTQQLYRVPFK